MGVHLKVEDLSFSYTSDTQALKDVSFSVGPGEILGILGPNGGGKSTLLKLIVGRMTHKKGSITFLDENKSKIELLKISYIPQREEINLSYPITVEEVLMSAREPFGEVKGFEVQEALEKVSFTKDSKQKIRTLSGGEFQRVLLAKAFLINASLILMDEPTKGLDGIGQDNMLKLIQEFKNEHQATIILVEHNIAQVLKHADRILCLNKSFHWHDHKGSLEKDILESTYHCEFEHLMIHESKGSILDHDHHFCDENYNKKKED